jgi:hypothetical protein
MAQIMNDVEILKEIERRIAEWFKVGGWAEENAGLSTIQKTIEDLRKDGKSPEW